MTYMLQCLALAGRKMIPSHNIVCVNLVASKLINQLPVATGVGGCTQEVSGRKAGRR